MKWVFLILVFLNIVFFVTGYSGSEGFIIQPDKLREGLELKLLKELSDEEMNGFTQQKVDQEKRVRQVEKQARAEKVLQEGDDVLSSMLNPNRKEIDVGFDYVSAIPGYRCQAIGPIKSLEQAEQIARWVKEHDPEAVARKNLKEKHLGFWVVLPKLDSMSGAKKKLDELKLAGIRDAYMFTRGELKMAISLGLFNRRDHAESRQKELQERYEVSVEIKPRIKDESDYWVDYKLQNGKLPNKLRRKITAESSRIRYKSWQCRVVAS